MLLSKKDQDKFAEQYPFYPNPVLMYIYKMNPNQFTMYVRRSKLAKPGGNKILRINYHKALEIIHSTETCEELAERLELKKEIILKFRELL